METRNVFVVGAGFMGTGIAEAAALAGYSVVLYDLQEACLQAGMEEVRRSLGKFLSRGKVNREQYDAALANLETTTRLEDAARADLVIEAIPEERELKQETFSRLDSICPPHAILATNTSAIPISSIAAATGRPDRVVGTHFFGPVPLMRLCEIIAGVLTSSETMDAADAWARSLDKETVRVPRDIAGFIANRVTIPASLEAVRVVEAGEASVVEVDRVSSMGNPSGAGTLTIMDNAGLDVSLAAALAIYEDTADPPFLPAAAAAPHGGGGLARAQIGPGLLRLRKRGEEGLRADRSGSDRGRDGQGPRPLQPHPQPYLPAHGHRGDTPAGSKSDQCRGHRQGGVPGLQLSPGAPRSCRLHGAG